MSMRVILRRGDEIADPVRQEYPKACWRRERLWLDLEDGRDYEAPASSKQSPQLTAVASRRTSGILVSK
jgi:hypothetical protein